MEAIVHKSPFFHRMTPVDLIARHVKTKEEYMRLYLSSLKTFTQNEKEELEHLAMIADSKLKRDYPEIANIPWKFAKISEDIEMGWPHTIEDVIILTRVPDVSILIHEKIHVYQRMFPLKTEEFIEEKGFVRAGHRSDFALLRNNPDTNEYIYSIGNCVEIYQMYNSYHPSDLKDSTLSCLHAKDMYEHPYEFMAYYITNSLMEHVPNTL